MLLLLLLLLLLGVGVGVVLVVVAANLMATCCSTVSVNRIVVSCWLLVISCCCRGFIRYLVNLFVYVFVLSGWLVSFESLVG